MTLAPVRHIETILVDRSKDAVDPLSRRFVDVTRFVGHIGIDPVHPVEHLPAIAPTGAVRDGLCFEESYRPVGEVLLQAIGGRDADKSAADDGDRDLYSARERSRRPVGLLVRQLHRAVVVE